MIHTEQSLGEIVCLVDDDPAVLKSIGRLLSSDGFSVRSFQEPKNFLAYVESNTVALVILDIWMEAMSGLQVQERLAAISPGTKVIIITGGQDDNAREAALQAGACAFFAKPFDDEEFLNAVHVAADVAK